MRRVSRHFAWAVLLFLASPFAAAAVIEEIPPGEGDHYKLFMSLSGMSFVETQPHIVELKRVLGADHRSWFPYYDVAAGTPRSYYVVDRDGRQKHLTEPLEVGYRTMWVPWDKEKNRAVVAPPEHGLEAYYNGWLYTFGAGWPWLHIGIAAVVLLSCVIDVARSEAREPLKGLKTVLIGRGGLIFVLVALLTLEGMRWVAYHENVTTLNAYLDTRQLPDGNFLPLIQSPRPEPEPYFLLKPLAPLSFAAMHVWFAFFLYTGGLGYARGLRGLVTNLAGALRNRGAGAAEVAGATPPPNRAEDAPPEEGSESERREFEALRKRIEADIEFMEGLEEWDRTHGGSR